MLSEQSIGTRVWIVALSPKGCCFFVCSPRRIILPFFWIIPQGRLPQRKNIQRQLSPNGSIAAPDAKLNLSDFEQKRASGRIPERLFLPSRPNCWLRNFTELADRSRAVTASREHARFRRKLYTISLSWICSAVNERCGCTQQNYE